MQHNLLDTAKSAEHGSLTSYIIGFTASVVLTLGAYFLVTEQLLLGWNLILALIGLAIVQVGVQFAFFLHLSTSSPIWDLVVLFFMTIVLVILVFGTLWVMYNLDYNMMSHS